MQSECAPKRERESALWLSSECCLYKQYVILWYSYKWCSAKLALPCLLQIIECEESYMFRIWRQSYFVWILQWRLERVACLLVHCHWQHRRLVYNHSNVLVSSIKHNNLFWFIPSFLVKIVLVDDCAGRRQTSHLSAEFDLELIVDTLNYLT